MRGKWYVAGVGVITCLLLVASCNTVDVLSSQGLDQSVSGDPAVLTVTGDAQINQLWPLSRMSSRLGSGELRAAFLIHQQPVATGGVGELYSHAQK